MSSPDDSQKNHSAGRFMLILAWVGGLGLLTLLFDDVLRARLNPNEQPEVRVATDGSQEVVLQSNIKGHYVADGAINGRRVTFLLDTGATDVAIPEALANQLRLPRLAGGVSQTANGPVAVWQTRLDQVRLGSITLRDVRAAILPSMDEDDAVLLGMSFLQQLDFSQRDGTLILHAPGTGG